MESPFHSALVCYDGDMRLIKMSTTHCPGCGQPFIEATQEDGSTVVGCETCGRKMVSRIPKTITAEMICMDMAVPA